MYRTLLSTALMATIFLTGCGGAGKTENSENKKSDNKAAESTENKSAETGGGASTLPADQQAEVGIEVDLATLMKDETVATGLKSIPGVPEFVNSMTGLSIYVSLPSNPEMAMNPAGYDFYAALSFANDSASEEAFNMAFAAAPLEEAEVNGKTFKKLAEPGMPAIYIHQAGGKIAVYSENYVQSGATSFAGKGLQTAMNDAVDGLQYKIAVDVAGAKDILSSFSAMLPPQAEAFMNSKTLFAGGGMGETMFVLAVQAGDEDTAKKVKASIQAGIAALAVAAGASLPPEDVAPATNEMYQHVMSNLKPKVEGNGVKVTIPRPSNYEELAKKMAAEAKKIGEELVPGNEPPGEDIPLPDDLK